jgi:hypothetical protein
VTFFDAYRLDMNSSLEEMPETITFD